MRHFLTYSLSLLCLSLFFASCSKHSDEPEPTPQPTMGNRTVLVYVAGENKLSRFFGGELQEMRQGSKLLGEGDHLLLYVDLADRNRHPYIMEVSQGDTATIYQYDKESLASDPDQMLDVISRAFTLRPARSYGLTLWGHASGWLVSADSVSHALGVRRRAFGVDNGFNDGSSNQGRWMNIPTLAKVLSRVGKPLKFIFGDCCNFQCAEVAYELRGQAEYIIGSPAEIPGVGAPYGTVLPAMFSQSDEFYRQMVDAYFAQVVAGHKEPLSVVRTSEMEGLAVATRTLLSNIAAHDGKGVDNFFDTSGLIYYYSSGWDATTKVMFDMNDLFLRYAPSADYAVWRQAFDRAVVYTTMATSWETANLVFFNDFDITAERYGGMSMFVPQPSANNIYTDYNRDIRKMGWYYAAGIATLFAGV